MWLHSGSSWQCDTALAALLSAVLAAHGRRPSASPAPHTDCALQLTSAAFARCPIALYTLAMLPILCRFLIRAVTADFLSLQHTKPHSHSFMDPPPGELSQHVSSYLSA